MAVQTPQKQKVKSSIIKGIKYLLDAEGNPEAVIIDLKKHGSLWEDFQDLLVVKKRRKEPRVSMEEVETSLRKQGKIT